METIGTIRQRADARSALQPSRSSCANLPLRTTQERDKVLLQYNPSRQTEIAADPERAFTEQCPTLAELRRDYGENAPIMWLVAQLNDLNEYAGAKKMDAPQMKAAARVLYADSYYLTLAEWMLFLYHVKAGKYGKFFGTVDALQLGVWLQSFKRERNDAHERRERSENVQRINAGRAEAVSYEEYLRRRGLPADWSPLKRESDAVQE